MNLFRSYKDPIHVSTYSMYHGGKVLFCRILAFKILANDVQDTYQVEQNPKTCSCWIGIYTYMSHQPAEATMKC
uniref:Uncharacterized protein n=1 Tax=Arundo donax TaxID=35708 RepID=A0A0A8YPA6_ARUDO